MDQDDEFNYEGRGSSRDDPYRDYEGDQQDDDDQDRRNKGEDTNRGKLKDAELQQYSDLLAVQMAVQKLREALKRYDGEMLRRAVEDYEEMQLDQSEIYYVIGSAVSSDVIKYRKLLREARHSKRPNPDLLEDRIKAVKKITHRYEKLTIRLELFLKEDVEKCQQLYQRLNVKEKKSQILAMDKKTMAEIKHYSNPSPLVHRIMIASLLLLEQDEETTAMWPKVQSLCNPDGKDGMVQRMMRFDPRTVHADIIRRVRYLLKDITLAQAQKASPGAGTFFVWSKRVIGDDPEKESSEDQEPRSGTTRGDDNDDDDDDNRRRNRHDNADDDDDDDDSTDNDEDDYERRLKEEEQKKKDKAYYARTLQGWINKEKEIFAELKKGREEQKKTQSVASRQRPPEQIRPAAGRATRGPPGAYNRSPERTRNSNLRYL